MTLAIATAPATAESPSRSTMRTLEVFEAFRQAKRPLSLSKLAKLADIPTSTCHGVMRALKLAGFLFISTSRSGHN